MSNRFFTTVGSDLRSGFLPKEPPLTQLPETSPLNRRINEIALNLPVLLSKKYLRQAVEQLNAEFSDQKIQLDIRNTQQQDVAFLFLTMIAQAYIWEDKNNPMHVVPAVIGNTLDLLCKLQNRFPTLTYTDYALRNFKLKENDAGITLDNIDPILTFTGSKDEAWFIKIHIVIEAIASKAIFAAYQACTRDDLTESALCELLRVVASTMNKTLPILDEMKNGCNPGYFYHTIRPIYTGWNQIKYQNHTGIQLNGFKLLGEDLLLSYTGASGAQSAILPLLDAALGIKHEKNAVSETLREFQNYMPKAQRNIIALLKEKNLYAKIASSHNPDLQQAWQDAVASIALFRGKHIGYLGKYIVQPSGQRAENILGTGGTTITEYLSERHATTRASLSRM